MKQDHDYYRSDARMPGEARPFSYTDRTTWPWRLRFIDWLGRMLGVDKIVEALPEPQDEGKL